MDKIVEEINEQLELSIKEFNTSKALVYVEMARKLVQQLYYDLWIKHHRKK